jgi:hypothetical protein
MKDIYKWECKKSLYTTTSAYNMNEVEKQVHKLLFENKMSIWLRNGACPSGQGKENDQILTLNYSRIP